MAQNDLLVFLQERLRAFDENWDVSTGSPADTRIIQPILRRLGSDPFTMDMGLFLQDRMAQEFPDVASKEGDAVTDLLIKPATLLWDPFLREVFRIRNSLSFRDPSTLTLDEATALGANLFSTPDTGALSRGRGRIYFAQPQSVSITPANYFTSSAGLHFFPQGVQSIRADEMILNTEASLYYFDVNLTAEFAGDEYNIAPDDLVSIANVTSAVRVTNKRRFRDGAPADDAETFVGRAQQELTERSLVTQRGIIAQISNTFSEVTQIADVGFNDPEMQRDVLSGGGLGKILASGFNGSGVPDGENKLRTRRFAHADAANFLTLIGPASAIPHGYVLTIDNMFAGVDPRMRDLHIRRVLDASTLELEEQVLSLTATNGVWALRKNELTLSHIPGGILFPNGPNGEVTVPSDEIHIGGAVDILVRGADFDSLTLLLDSVTDDSPIKQGLLLHSENILGLIYARLTDFVLAPFVPPPGSIQVQYQVGDDVYQDFANAKIKGYTLQILQAPLAGSYRVIDVIQSPGAAPLFLTDPPLPIVSGVDMRWRLLDEIDIELAEPKETRVAGSDLKTIAGVPAVTTQSAVDFQTLGVSIGDVLRIFNGPDAGDYTVTASPIPPFHISLQIDRSPTQSSSSLQYAIFRPNAAGGIELPFIRISSIDLLDSSGQPVGSKVPYARPVDARSQAFANTGHGVRVDVTDGRLGIVTRSLGSPAQANVSGLKFVVDSDDPGALTVTFSGGNPVSMANMISQINSQATSFGFGPIAYQVSADRFGIVSVGANTKVSSGSPSAMTQLFGDEQDRFSSDVRSGTTSWDLLPLPPTADLDALNVLDGNQIGFYSLQDPAFAGGSDSVLKTTHEFSPEVGRHIQFGSRSVGTARVFFLEPTTIEFGPDTIFTTTNADGAPVRFILDPSVSAQRIPAPPNGPQPKSGTVTIGQALNDGTQDFIKLGIHVDDLISFTYVPITGTVNLADPIVNLAGKTLVISLAGGPDQTITFLNDSSSIPATDVTRAGMVSQLNNAVGQVIAKTVTSGPNTFLELEPTVLLIIRASSTAATMLLFASFPSDKNNKSLNNLPGMPFPITAVTTSSLSVDAGGALVAETRVQYQIVRPGTQRLSSTAMNLNTTSAGLYFFDVELVSEGTGDQWNITADLLMTVEGYESDGYFLTTDDPNLTFSPVERARLHLSRTILEVGVSDDPSNATQLSGQNLQLNYDQSSLVGSVSNFVTADTERVVCASPLARHLIPHFVRFDLFYIGGPKESELVPALEDLINGVDPSEFLTVSAIEAETMGKGASAITNPLELVAVVHNVDRTVSLDRSKDKINTGRLAAFLPDLLNVKREVT